MAGSSFRKRASQFASLLLCGAIVTQPAQAYGWRGHEAVGRIAQQLLMGHKAAAHVDAILGNLTLEKAGPWADCAKNVSSTGKYVPPKKPKPKPGQKEQKDICEVLYDTTDQGQMIAYAKLNWNNCEALLPRAPSGKPFKDDLNRIHRNGCHRLYHFEDIAIQNAAYRDGLIGTDPYDLVHALQAAILELEGRPVPQLFSFGDTNAVRDKVALMLLVHFMGDLHQPLHVGCVYLDKAGKAIDPDALPLSQGLVVEQENSTIGGNALLITRTGGLHSKWDGIDNPPQAYALSNTLSLPGGNDRTSWVNAWANESFLDARAAFQDVTFEPYRLEQEKTANTPALSEGWPTKLPDNYTMGQSEKLQRAGWRLAQLLMAIWPD